MTSDVNEWAYKKANIRIHFLHSNRDIFGDDRPRKMGLIWFSFLPHEPTTHNISLSFFFFGRFLPNGTFLQTPCLEENVMLDSQGYLKLVDFGLAKDLMDGSKTFTVVGTAAWFHLEGFGHRWFTVFFHFLPGLLGLNFRCTTWRLRSSEVLVTAWKRIFGPWGFCCTKWYVGNYHLAMSCLVEI